MERIRHHSIILLILLLVPLFVSFIIWIVGSAFATGGGVAPGVFYGAVLHDMSSLSTLTNARLRRARVTRAMPGDGDRRKYNEALVRRGSWI